LNKKFLCLVELFIGLAFATVHTVLAQEKIEVSVYPDGEVREYNVVNGDPSLSWRLASGNYVVKFGRGAIKVDDEKWEILEHSPMVYPGKEYIVAGYTKDDVQNFRNKWWGSFPLKVGMTWSTRYKGGRRENWRDAEFEILAFEDVVTPAGKFKAYKIKRSSDYTEDFYWYSPEIHGAVRFVTNREFRRDNVTVKTVVELRKKYTQGPPS